MDNGSNQRDVVPDTYDVSMLWGPSEFDARHIWPSITSTNCHSSRPRDVERQASGGWQISGITQFQTGYLAALRRVRLHC